MEERYHSNEFVQDNDMYGMLISMILAVPLKGTFNSHHILFCGSELHDYSSHVQPIAHGKRGVDEEKKKKKEKLFVGLLPSGDGIPTCTVSCRNVIF